MPDNPYAKVPAEVLRRRDSLARDRTILAPERTLLASIQTALAFVLSGFSRIKFFDAFSLASIG